MGDKGWIEVQAELQAYLDLALVVLWEEICSRKFLISAKETHLQSNNTGNVNYLSLVFKRAGSLVRVREKILAADPPPREDKWRLDRQNFSRTRTSEPAPRLPSTRWDTSMYNLGYLPLEQRVGRASLR